MQLCKHKCNICVQALTVMTVNYAINVWFKDACGGATSGMTHIKTASDKTISKSPVGERKSCTQKKHVFFFFPCRSKLFSKTVPDTITFNQSEVKRSSECLASRRAGAALDGLQIPLAHRQGRSMPGTGTAGGGGGVWGCLVISHLKS